MSRMDKYDSADLVDLCLYQQDIIKQYERYIESYIHQPIQKVVDKYREHINFNEQVITERIILPMTQIVALCSPRVVRNWELIKHETPMVPVRYFIDMGHKYEEEEKRC